MADTKMPEVAETEWRLGWAAGYFAALNGEPSPWRDGKTPERRIHPGQHWEHGYKQGYARAEDQQSRRVKVQTSARWDDAAGN